MERLKVVETADGSKTIWNETVGEHYHSRHGAFQESRHVFLRAGLEYSLEQTGANSISVLEMGFGTGLNFLLSAEYCQEHNIALYYEGIEAYPLDKDLLEQTGYENLVHPQIWPSFIAAYPKALQSGVQLHSGCTLSIAHTMLQNFETDQQFDVLYFDAFAAIHQPELWQKAALERCSAPLKPGGVFVTYAITGNLKRTLKEIGFDIQKLPGAPGKREMLRAIKKN